MADLLNTVQTDVVEKIVANMHMLEKLCKQEKLALQEQCAAKAAQLNEQTTALTSLLRAEQSAHAAAKQQRSDAQARVEELSAEVQTLSAQIDAQTTELTRQVYEEMKEEKSELREAQTAYWKQNTAVQESVSDFRNTVQTQANAEIAGWLTERQTQLRGMLKDGMIDKTKNALSLHVGDWLDATFHKMAPEFVQALKDEMASMLLRKVDDKGLVAGFHNSEGAGDPTSRPFLVFEDRQWTLRPVES